MNRFVILSILTVMSIISGTVTAQEIPDTPETYVCEVVVDLPWGDGPQEVGLWTEPGWTEGPMSFEVDDNGMIYIQDSINLRMLVFDRAGQHVRTFPIHGRGGSALDDEGNIYINNSAEHELLKYSPEGVLLESIEYVLEKGPNVYVRNVDIINGTFYVGYRKLSVKEKSDKKGQYGVTTYVAHTVSREEYDNPLNIGRTSHGVYKYGKERVITRQIPGKSDEIINLDFIPVRKMPTIYVSEDKFGNMYFKTYRDDETRTREYWKVSPDFKLLALIGPIAAPGMYDKMKELIITSNGEIYQMQPEKSGLKVYKWNKKE